MKEILTVELEIDERIIEAEIQATILKSGIGFYEYWGMKGFDEGNDYMEEFEILHAEEDGRELSKEEIKKLEEKIMEDDALFLSIENNFLEV